VTLKPCGRRPSLINASDNGAYLCNLIVANLKRLLGGGLGCDGSATFNILNSVWHWQQGCTNLHVTASRIGRHIITTSGSGRQKVSGQERFYRKNSRFHAKILHQRKFTKI